jgi:hypothetical protein
MDDQTGSAAAGELPRHGAPAPGSSSVAPEGRSSHPNGRRVSGVALKLAATATVLAVGALLVGTATWSNLNATATNPSNSINAGTVQLTSGSFTAPVISLTSAKPGAVSTGCIQITNSGTLSVQMKLYGTGPGTGLNEYLKLVVTRGSFSGTPPAGSCNGFTPDATNYIAQGVGVIYSGTLANWPSSASSALPDPTASSPATWSPQATHSYQFQVTVLSDARAQGLTGHQTFTFEEVSV